MTQYALDLPSQLKSHAEQLATLQGISLNQFILWSVAEKVGALQQMLDGPHFPGIIYRYGTSGIGMPVLRGTGLRVQTVVIDVHQVGMTPAQVAAEYDLPEARIIEALAFYAAHQTEIDANIAAESALTPSHG